MKQTLEEAAKEAAEDCYEMPYDEKLINMKLIKEAFKYGAEWQSKQSPWISVKDRLPELGDPVLIRLKDGTVRLAVLDTTIIAMHISGVIIIPMKRLAVGIQPIGCQSLLLNQREIDHE